MLNKLLAIGLIAIALFLTFQKGDERVVKKDPVNNIQAQQPELIDLIKKDNPRLKVIKINKFNISCLKNSCAAYLRKNPKDVVLTTGKNKKEAYQKILNYINQ